MLRARTRQAPACCARCQRCRESRGRGHVREALQSVAVASSEIASGNNDLSARTEQQASALQQTAASMEQLNSTVRQNADNAQPGQPAGARAPRRWPTQGGEVVQPGGAAP